MKFKKDQQAEVLSNFDTDSIDMTIDDSDKQVLMHILSTGLYQDPIGSLIRENVSNNLDATVEAGSTEPVIVGLKQDESYNWYFYSQDFGTGISPERMENIVSKYAASTKRNSDTQKGMFGLGIKSGLAYTDSFWIITNHDNIKYSYLMYKGDTGSKIELMDQVPTDDRNGTTFKVYLKDSYDRSSFKEKIKEQLSYIENLYFDIEGYSNDYKIYKTDNWWYLPNHIDKCLHIVLDGIYYPIDFNKLGISRIDIPIAIKFDCTDGLVPVPSRESIIMTPATMQLIKDKIGIIATDIVERYNNSNQDITDWFGYLTKIEDTSKRLYLGNNIPSFEIKSILKFTDIKPNDPVFTGFEFKYLTASSLKHRVQKFIDYRTYQIGEVINNRYTSKGSKRSLYYIIDSSSYYRDRSTFITSNPPVSKMMIDYLKDNYGKKGCVLYKISSPRYRLKANIPYIPDYVNTLSLRNYPKDKWRDMIKEFQAFIQYIIDTYTVNLDNLVIPDDWIAERKKKQLESRKAREIKEKGVFVLKYIIPSDRSDWGGTTNNINIDTESVRKLKKLHVYGSDDDKEKLAKLSAISYKYQCRISVVSVAKNNLKKLANLKNFITYDEFMKGETKPFSVYATAIHIAQELQEVQHYNTISSRIEQIMPKFTKIKTIIDNYTCMVYRINSELANVIVAHAKENNLFDITMMAEFHELKEYVESLDFLKHLDMRYYAHDSDRDKSLTKFIREVQGYRMMNKRKMKAQLENENIETEIVINETI